MKLKRLVIIGAGAVGGCIGGLLADVGFPVVMVARGPHGEKIRTSGLLVKSPTRSIVVHPDCYERIEQVDWRDGDVVLIATKLNDAKTVMDQLLGVVGADVPVVCASNGMQGEIWANERFAVVLSMLVWMPSAHLDPGDIRVYGEKCPGVLDLGRVVGECESALVESLCNWLRAASFDSVSRPDIKRWKYAKWITNLGNTAQALVTDDWKSIAKLAQAEGEHVLTVAGVDRVSTVELLDRTSHIKLSTIDGDSRAGGSTWQSFQRGKPLESRWIEGALADLADAIGESAVVNRALADFAQTPVPLMAEDVLSKIA